MQVRKIMQFLTRNSIQLRRDMEGSRLETVVRNHCNVGFVENITIRRIVHCIRVEERISTMLKRKILLEMLVITFLGSMQHLITTRRITRHPLLRWKVSYVIKLFPF